MPPLGAKSTKKFVGDVIDTDVTSKATVRASTVLALNDSGYNNGNQGEGATITSDINEPLPKQDNVQLVVDDLLLVKNEVAGIRNGRYQVTDLGGAGSKWILTRDVRADESDEFDSNQNMYVAEGDVNSDQIFTLVTDTDPIIIGTTSLDYRLPSSSFAELGVRSPVVEINQGGTQATADAQSAGFIVKMTDATDALIGYDSTLTSKFKIGEVGSEEEIVGTGFAQTLTNKILTAPDINGGTADALTSLSVRSTGLGGLNMKIANSEELTISDKTLTIKLNDSDRNLDISGDVALNQNLRVADSPAFAGLNVKGDSPGNVGGFPSGALQVTSPSTDVNANAVITGHNSNGGNKQLWYLGSASSSNDNITFINRQNADLSLGTNNVIGLTVTGGDGGVVILPFQIKIEGGVPGVNKVLTSDADGLATWEAAAVSESLSATLAVGNTTGAKDIIFSKKGTATSTATQKSSQSVEFEMSGFDGAAEAIAKWSIQGIASTTVNEDSRLSFSLDGVEKFAVLKSSIAVDKIFELTAAAGVTIDGVLIKDTGIVFDSSATQKIIGDSNSNAALLIGLFNPGDISLSPDNGNFGATSGGELYLNPDASGAEATLYLNGNIAIQAAALATILQFEGLTGYVQDTNRIRIGASTKDLGFYGAAGASKPTITGSRGGNAALASFLSSIDSQGLITDSTTA